MSQSPFMPSEPKRRWQFTIRGMLIFTASVAVGVSGMQLEYLYCLERAKLEAASGRQEPASLDWQTGILAVILIWMAAGLVYQIRDLRDFLSENPSIDKEQKLGLRVEIAWRAAVLLGLSLYSLMSIFLYCGVISLPDSDDISFSLIGGGSAIREGFLVVLMMLIVASVPRFRRKPKGSRLKLLVEILACVCAAAICAYRWIDETYTYYLVHLATTGIDYANSLEYSRIDAARYRGLSSLYFYWSLVSGAAVILNWICLRKIADRWPKSGFRQWPLILFSLGILFVVGYDLWILLYGLKRLSPAFAEVGFVEPFHYWIAAGVILFVLIAAMTYSLAVERRASQEEASLSWQKNAGKYYHQWRTVLFGLAAVYFGFYLYAAIRSFFQPYATVDASSILYVLAEIFYFPLQCLWLGAVVLALDRAFAKRVDPDRPHTPLPRIERTKFIVMWLTSAAFVVSGSLALVWMSFGLWFNPWIGGR